MVHTGAVGAVGREEPTRAARLPRGRWLAALVLIGLALVVTGTFLPWLRSGTVDRNSYAADAAIRHILNLDGVLGAVLTAWPFLGLVCGAAAALLVLGYVRSGAALAALGALDAGGVSVAVLASSGSSLIRPATSGPVSTLAGSALVLATVLLYFVTMIIGDRTPRPWSGRVQ